MATIKKVLTDCPFVDEIVYNTKIMVYGTVLKNDTLATAAENADTARNGAIYMICKTDTENFEIFPEFSKSTLDALNISTTPTEEYPAGLRKAIEANKNNMPVEYRDAAIALEKQHVIDNYVEQNNYYRMLNGLPDTDMTTFVYVTPDLIPIGSEAVIDFTKPVHLMTNQEIGIIEELGIIDKLMILYPTQKYLRHLGDKKIDYTMARQAAPFDVLYVPSIDFDAVRETYIDRLNVNTIYAKRCLYTEAFKLASDQYYDNFICLYIVIQAAIDLLSETQVYIATRQVFDVRSIQYIFASYGVPYYNEIPVRYQLAMMRNINKLIKYKATTINMIDICSLFGFDNVQIFKYYLFRHQKFNSDTDKYQITMNDITCVDCNGTGMIGDTPCLSCNGTGTISERNYDADFDLNFVKIPLSKLADNYLRDQPNYYSYESIVAQDGLWDDNGTLPIKQQLLETEFSAVRTKYFSIDTIYEIAEVSLQIPYLFNMLFDNFKPEDSLRLKVTSISNSTDFRFSDLITLIFSLSYLYYDLEDTIFADPTGILKVQGFDFQRNMADIATYIANKGYTLADFGISDFRTKYNTVENYLSFGQLLEVYTANKNAMENVCRGMKDADTYDIYKIYEYLYNALMTATYTDTYFTSKIPTGEDITYSNYLKYQSPVLFDLIETIAAIGDPTHLEERQTTISKYMADIIYAIETYMDSDEFKYIFNGVPGDASNNIQKYIFKVLTFFKSFKIDLLGMSSIYNVSESNFPLRAHDKLASMTIGLTTPDLFYPKESIHEAVTTSYKDSYRPLDTMYVSVS